MNTYFQVRFDTDEGENQLVPGYFINPAVARAYANLINHSTHYSGQIIRATRVESVTDTRGAS